MFFPSHLDENTTILIEAETSSAFAKSDLEERPDIHRAFHHAITLASKMAAVMNETFGPNGSPHGTATISFGVRINNSGAVMLSQTPDKAQIQVAIRFGS